MRKPTSQLWAVAVAAVVAAGLAPAAYGQVRAADPWKMTRTIDPMTDKPIVTAIVTATGKIEGWLSTFTPQLVVRCQTPPPGDSMTIVAKKVPTSPLQPGLDFYVVTGMPATVESEGLHSVQIRFDSGEAVSENGKESTDGKALMLSPYFSTMTILFKDTLAHSSRMLFRFTPFNASPVTVTFNVAGFAGHKDQVIAACPAVDRSIWK